MIAVALLTVRGRWSAFAGAFVALLVAGALVTASAELLQAGLEIGIPAGRYAAAPIVVAHQQVLQTPAQSYFGRREGPRPVALPELARIDRSVAARLDRVSGVSSVIADISVPVAVAGSRGQLVTSAGKPSYLHGWSSAALTPYRVVAGQPPRGPGDLAADVTLAAAGHLHVGSRVSLGTTSPARSWTITGIVAPAAPVPAQSAVFGTDAQVLALSASPDRADALGVIPAPRANVPELARRLQAVAGPGIQILQGSARGAIEYPALEQAKQNVVTLTGTLGSLALVTAVLVVASTIGLAMQQRERELALLRTIGATPLQVWLMTVFETVVVAVIASVVGAVPGVFGARLLGDMMSRQGIAPPALSVPPGWLPILVSVAAVTVTAAVAAFAAGVRAARVPPVLALAESAPQPRRLGRTRLVLGVVTLGAGAALVAAAAAAGAASPASVGAAGGAAFVFVIGVALLGPLIAGLTGRLASWPLSHLARATGILAAINIRTSARRFASALVPLTLGVTMAGSLLFLPATEDHAVSTQDNARQAAQFVLSSAGPGLAPTVVADAKAVPGVAAAVGVRATSVIPLGSGWSAIYRLQPVDAQALDGSDIGQVLHLQVRAGSLSSLRGDSMALSAQLADASGVHTGQVLRLDLGDGTPVQLRVTAIFARSLGFGDVLVPGGLVLPHVTQPLLSTVLIRLAPSAAAPHVASLLRALAGRYPGLQVGTGSAITSAHAQQLRLNDWADGLVALVICAFAAIAALNTLAMITLSRRREAGTLRLAGATRRQVALISWHEAGILALTCLAIGGVITLVTLVSVAQGLGAGVRPFVPAGQVFAIIAAVILISSAGTWLPGRAILRTRPIEAIGIRE